MEYIFAAVFSGDQQCWFNIGVTEIYWLVSTYSTPSTFAPNSSSVGTRLTRRDALPRIRMRESLWNRCRTSACSSFTTAKLLKATSNICFTLKILATAKGSTAHGQNSKRSTIDMAPITEKHCPSLCSNLQFKLIILARSVISLWQQPILLKHSLFKPSWQAPSSHGGEPPGSGTFQGVLLHRAWSHRQAVALRRYRHGGDPSPLHSFRPWKESFMGFCAENFSVMTSFRLSPSYIYSNNLSAQVCFPSLYVGNTHFCNVYITRVLVPNCWWNHYIRLGVTFDLLVHRTDYSQILRQCQISCN